MGSTSCNAWTTKAKTIKATLADYGSGDVIETASVGAGLWVLAKGAGDILRIDFHAMTRYGGCYSVKSMSEGMGPSFYDVPVAWLDRAPEQSADWRAKVRKTAAAKVAVFNVGDEVLVHGRAYVITGTHKRSYLIQNENGKVFKTSAGNIQLRSEVEREQAETRARVLAAPFKVISAFGDWHKDVPSGFVGVTATRDGNRAGIGPEINVLVPACEYTGGGFVLTGSERAWAVAS